MIRDFFHSFITRKGFILALFILVCLELYSVLPPRFPVSSSKPYLEGIFHVHSRYSHDGGGTPEQIAAAARAAGIDLVWITDHNTDAGFREGKEGRYDGVDLYFENEVSVAMGHVVTLYTHTPDVRHNKETIGGYSHNEALGESHLHPDSFQVAAHPTNLKHPWTRLDHVPEGVEIINFDSLWRRQLREKPLGFLFTAGASILNPFLSALRFYELHPKDMEIWDHSNALSTHHFGILGQDSHQRIELGIRQVALPWPEYRRDFAIASNAIRPPEILADNFADQKKQVYRWLREGRFALFFRLLHPFDAYDWKIRCQTEVFRSGDRLSSKGCYHEFQLPPSPYPHFVRVWRNGYLESTLSQTEARSPYTLKGPGTYRVEVWARVKSLSGLVIHRAVPILLYNPIFVE